jgi:anti-sigma regulatory factor (Ser/Thr protein kinase)
MAAENASRSNGHRVDPAESPFPRFRERRRERPEWLGIDLGGHDAVSRLQMHLRPGPEAAGESRRALERLTGSLDDEQLDTLRLLVTELVTNSVRHAGTQHWIELDVDLYANAIRAQVRDHGAGFDPPEQPEPHPDRPGGWGLCLVDTLADRWGVALDETTCVWFELDRGHPPRFARA